MANTPAEKRKSQYIEIDEKYHVSHPIKIQHYYIRWNYAQQTVQEFTTNCTKERQITKRTNRAVPKFLIQFSSKCQQIKLK